MWEVFGEPVDFSYLHEDGSVDPRLKVRLTKLNPGIIVFLNYIARNGNHTPQDTSLFLTVSKEAFWCSRRSLEAL